MPAIAHIGIGFAAKKALHAVNVLLLIIAAEFIEIVFMVLWGLGIEHPPTDTLQPYSPYSHSILMGLTWPVFMGLLILTLSRNKRLSLIIGLLVLSHFILDFIASPKTAFYAADTGMPWLADYTSTYGLGIWSNGIVAGIGEIGFLVAGIIIYYVTVRKIRAEKKIGIKTDR
jgi:hypothetical protein